MKIIIFKNFSEAQAFNERNSTIKISVLICLFFSLLSIHQIDIENYLENKKEKINFDQYEIHRYNEIKQLLIENHCVDLWDNQAEFLNGIIRHFHPIKILEIGVKFGGSSIIILNAIKDLKNSKLFSIDLSSSKRIGKCVRNLFPNFYKKWSLFTGNIATEFIEKIGNKIDTVFIDSAHFEPGEIIDFLIILPFLKEGAIIIIHDIANQITISKERNEWAPYIIFNGIRGEKFFPSGNKILTNDIGAIKLEKNQKKFLS